MSGRAFTRAGLGPGALVPVFPSTALGGCFSGCFCLEVGFLVAQMVNKIWLQCGRPRFDLWVRRIPPEKGMTAHSVFLPGEFQGQRSIAGYSPWGHKESDRTE